MSVTVVRGGETTREDEGTVSQRLLATAATLAMAAGSLAPAAGASTTGREHGRPRVSSMLLDRHQMPAGWRVTRVGGGVLSASGCLAPRGMPKATGQASRAFARTGSTLELVEKLAAFGSLPAKRFDLALRAFAHCPALAFQADGEQVRATVTKVALPRVGDQSVAYALSFPARFYTFGIDAVLARKGRFALMLLETGIGSPSTVQLEHFARRAVAKVH